MKRHRNQPTRDRASRRAVWIAAASAAPLLFTGAAHAQSNWIAGSGNWSLGSNWSPSGVPAAGAAVTAISADSTSRTITFDYSYASPLASFSIDNSGSGTNTLTLSNASGVLQTASLTGDQFIGINGNARVFHSAGTNTVGGSLYIGAGNASSGTNAVGLYAMSNTASLTVQGDEHIGSWRDLSTGYYGKSGTFTQTGGSHTVDTNLNIAYAGGSTGTFSISGGTLTVGAELNVGWSGTGSFTQNGGTVSVGSLWLFPDATASFAISSGIFQANSMQVSTGAGTATCNFTGGTTTIAGTLDVANAATITFSNTAALTTAIDNITAGTEGSGGYFQSGGTHNTGALTGNGTIQVTGGTYSVGAGGASIGNFTLVSPGAFTVTGDETFYNDDSRFTQPGGTHTVNGSLLINAVPLTLAAPTHFQLSGGTVTVGVRLALGDTAGTRGMFAQTGGKLTTPVLDIGKGGAASYTLSGGTLAASVTNIHANGSLILAGGSFSGTSIATMAGKFSVQGDTALNLSNTMTLVPTSAMEVNAHLNISSPVIANDGGNISGTGRITLGAGSGLNGFGIVTPVITTSAPISARSGNLTLTGASFVANSGATLSNNVGANLFILATSVTNSGSITVNAAGSVVFENAAITNAAGKTITLAGGALAAPTLVNNGTLQGSGSFTGSLTNAATISLNGPSQIFGPLVNQSAGSITVRNSQFLITGLTTNNGTIRAQTGGSVVFDGGLTGNPVSAPAAGAAVVESSASITTSYVHQSSLSLSGVAGSPSTYSRVSIRPRTEGGQTSLLESLAIATDGTGTPLGTLDLADTALIINYSSTSPLATMRSYIARGYNGGGANRWTGSGITSSVAASGIGMIGYAEASQVLGLTGSATGTFQGQTADATSLLVRYTLPGDSNLDGVVDFKDLASVAQNYNSPSLWKTGDFNYDGVTDFKDLAAVAQNYNQALPGSVPGANADFQADWSRALATAVPEPGSLSLLAMAIVPLLQRRRPTRR